MFNNQLLGRWGLVCVCRGFPICSLCWFLWYKYSYHGWSQTTNVMGLQRDLGPDPAVAQEVQGRGGEARRSSSHSILYGGSALILGVFLCLPHFFYLVTFLTLVPTVHFGRLVFFAGSILEEISSPCSHQGPRDHQNSRLRLGGWCWGWSWEAVEGLADLLWKGPVVHIFGFVGPMVSVATTNPPQDIVCWLLLYMIPLCHKPHWSVNYGYFKGPRGKSPFTLNQPMSSDQPMQRRDLGLGGGFVV